MTNQIMKDKRRYIGREKSLERIHYWVICGCAVLGVSYYGLLEPDTIGADNRYFWYVFIFPTLAGMLILGYYRRAFLITRFVLNKGFALWSFMIVFYFIQGVIFSYLSFGQVAKISWDYLNYRTAMANPEEVIVCDVKRFWSKKRPAIEFKFDSHHEEFRVDHDYIRSYKDVDPHGYQLKIEARKGIWNYYLVTGWQLEHK